MPSPEQTGLADRAARDLAIQALDSWDPLDREGFVGRTLPASATDPAMAGLKGLNPFDWVEATPEDKTELKARWLLFLRTDLPYERPGHVWSWPFRDRRQMWDAARAAGIVDADGKHPLFHTQRLRKGAARLLEQHLAGEIDEKQVVSQWPKTELDPALFRFEKYDKVLLRRYRKDGKMRPGRTAPGTTPLERYRLFLNTDSPYTWGRLAKENILVLVFAGIVVFLGGPAFLLWRERIFGNWAPGGLPAIVLVILWVLVGGPACYWASVWRQEHGLGRSLTRGRLRHWPFQSAGDLERAASGGREQAPAQAPFN